MVKFFSGHVYRPDDEVQLRRVGQQLFRPVEGHGRFAQLRAHADGQPVAAALPCLRHLPRHGGPVEAGAGQVTAPQNGVHVVGNAYLVQPAVDGRPGQLQHGDRPVRRHAGMGMIIR